MSAATKKFSTKPKPITEPTVAHEDGEMAEQTPAVTIPGLTMTSADAQAVRDRVQSRRGDDERSEGSRSSRSSIPSMVQAKTESGVEAGALELAKLFLKAQGQLARKCYRRGELSHLYVSTQGAWMPEATQDDVSLQRPFKQILFALAHGLHVVRVVDKGRALKWNRYRDDEGNKVEGHDGGHRGPPRQHGGRGGGYRGRGGYDGRDPREYRGDRRPYYREEHYDNRDRYDRRDGGRDYDRRGRSPSPYDRRPRSPQYDRDGRPMNRDSRGGGRGYGKGKGGGRGRYERRDDHGRQDRDGSAQGDQAEQSGGFQKVSYQRR